MTSERARVWLIAAAAVSAAGCFDVRFGDGVIACGEAGCPPGYTCASDDTCRRSSPAMGDAAAPDASPFGPCGTTELLADDFDDGVVHPQWAWSYGVVTEAGGEAVFSATAETWSAYSPIFDYDLTASRVFVEVTEVATGPEVYTRMGARRPSDLAGLESWVRLTHSDGTLYAEREHQGIYAELSSVPYDPLAHRWWQIREDRGTLYFEASSDGSSWQELATTPAFFDLTSIKPFLSLGASSLDPIGQTRFDNFNGGAPSTEGFCGTSTFSTTVDDALEIADAFYGWRSGNCVFDNGGGRISFELDRDAAGTCSYGSRKGFDLTGDSIAIEVPVAIGGPGDDAYTWFGVSTFDEENYVRFVVSAGRLEIERRVSSSSATILSMPHDPVAHRWWRFRESGGTLYAEVSSDGTSFVSHAVGSPAIDITAARVFLGAGTGMDPGTAHTVEFDNVNVTP